MAEIETGSGRPEAPQILAGDRLTPALGPENSGRMFAAAVGVAAILVFLTIAFIRPTSPDAKSLGPEISQQAVSIDDPATTQNQELALVESEQQLEKVISQTPAIFFQSITVKNGSNLMDTLLKAGTDRLDAHNAITAIGEVFNLRRLRAGQTIEVALRPADENEGNTKPDLISVIIPVSPERQVAAIRNDDGKFDSDDIAIALERKLVHAAGIIDDSLFLATDRAGVPARLIMDLIRVFSWDVDFQRDIRTGDKFEVLFERFRDEAGVDVKDGEVVIASLTLSGKEIRLYRHTLEDGTVDYFDAEGQSVRKALLRTPVDGARLSSGYGRRKHPILGYTKMHRGIDFAAPRGTPIMAAGDGMVEKAGRNGAYGNYIRIRHNSTYKSAYAHLKSFARGVRTGSRVKQGQIIGYVGSTGRSTGPHLHYEVLQNGSQTNPMKVKLPTGKKLAGTELAQLETHRDNLETALRLTAGTTETAAN
jgi:murein DD-endopeptidase MepM/ murein hydrolase activator NlpD